MIADISFCTSFSALHALSSPQALQVREAEAQLPEVANGVYLIQSSEQFDALVTVHPDREVVLLAGLSWCRPCKSLTRPMEKLAKHYDSGAVFAKVMGDLNDNTKLFFKNRLKVCPGCCFWTCLRGLFGNLSRSRCRVSVVDTLSGGSGCCFFAECSAPLLFVC